mmetsp:Transcript_313/g.1033  ORF Transcript_313/g.1033 Transcript_313/m.1033 type:complete len:105 (+) Transcript_313:401-715(+)
MDRTGRVTSNTKLEDCVGDRTPSPLPRGKEMNEDPLTRGWRTDRAKAPGEETRTEDEWAPLMPELMPQVGLLKLPVLAHLRFLRTGLHCDRSGRAEVGNLNTES